MEKIKVGVIGATGYAGAELVRLLVNHPNVEIAAVSSKSFEGQTLSQVYPNLLGACDMTLTNEDDLLQKSDVVFASLPHGLSEEIAVKCLAQGKKLIDIGADFRLSNPDDYKQWYGLDYKHPQTHEQSVYIIPELMRDKYQGQPIIGNPGCYPTSIALGLAPVVKNKMFVDNGIVIDSKSGATGAGRALAQNTHFPDCNEAFAPYKIASHRHTPEIEQTLGWLADKEVKVLFTPHLLPLNRGIVSTCYVSLDKEYTLDEVYNLYKDFYKDEKFVRVLPRGSIATLKNVKLSNYCDISLHLDTRTNRLIVVSAIDNMVKGAAGQAIQNMNIMYGLDEKTGLDFMPPAF